MEEGRRINSPTVGYGSVPEIEAPEEQDVKTKHALRIAFLVGAGALVVLIRYPYPLLSWQTTTLGLLALCLGSGVILVRVPREAKVAATDVLLVALPWLFSLMLLANGAMDSSQEVLHQAMVVRTRYRPGRTVTVHSWRQCNSTESVYVGGFLNRTGFYYPGQTITIGTRAGALGMPWVTRVTKKP